MAVALAKCMDLMTTSAVREILKVTERPEIISLAGGLPAPELFPVEEMKNVTIEVLEEAGGQALQYSTTEGFTPLRRQIAARMNRKFKTDFACENILITSGSQQALDFSGKLFLNEGDVVLCESPTYLTAISAFRVYKPTFVEVPTDDEGMIPDELEKVLASTANVKFIYVIPDFQNPTGRTWTWQRRRQFVEIINKYEIPVLEDNPYGELRFEGEILPSIKSLDTRGLVIALGTFSKTFCPGLRIGWIAADIKFIEKYIMIKQCADLHTSSMSQRQISKYMELYDFEQHIQQIIAVYRQRRDAMLDAMEQHFPSDIQYTRPQGGLFTWVELPPSINAIQLLTISLRHKVAFVPGESFFPNRHVPNTLRLNYSNMPEERIYEGIKRLAAAIRCYKAD
ncbi:PLP-dependent aminotransferase family protein [Sporomusa aerivorans]|uniref:aminotransferase-like domain-containing protein n=1 Tax=Sporomusa aerivorans TaxID=204936 RepID=UPI00352B093F